ncbi:hypothetical protein [Actinoplanes subglobosus]|uniref:Uncharacterized protein n=1 Tax=Actinoplanes subglobosus TaxID=1547892 RepID=A0ABV8IUQ3_9ACTN
MTAVIAAHALTGCTSTGPAPTSATTGPAPASVVADTTTPPADTPIPAAPASAEPPGTDDHAEPPAAARAAAAPAVAAGFAAAWVRRDLPARQWLAAVTPWCEPGFARLLATTDPRNLPSSKVVGTPQVIQAPAARSAEYTVSTDTGTLTVVLLDWRGQWRVSGNDYRPRS